MDQGRVQGQGLRPGLSLFDAATLVSGSMIGSGIFIVSADIARLVRSPLLLLAVWLVSGLMTVTGALAYGELAAMMPQAGGQYIYLREAFGTLWAFLFGWTLLLVIQTGTIAAVSVGFARFAGVLWPALSATLWVGYGNVGLSAERAGAIAVIALLTATNLGGLNAGRLVQNFFTTAKVLSLLLIVVLGLIIAPNPAALNANFLSRRALLGGQELSWSLAAAFGAAMVGGLFSADAWAAVTFSASEVRDPKRHLPLALALGTAVVIVLYILTNLAYLAELPVVGEASAHAVLARGISAARGDRVAAAAMQIIWGGAGAAITAVLVMISTFGCANGLILTGARVIWAMADDRLFFGSARRLNRAQVPSVALLMQGAWAALLTLSSSYGELLDYVIFTQLLFYVLTVGAVFVLRRRRPQAARPYRTWGYPWLPAGYIGAALALMADLLLVKPKFTLLGLLIVLSGVPAYGWWRGRGAAAASRAAATQLGAEDR